MDRLDPARTALLVTHMAKGVAGDVDTPFNRLLRSSSPTPAKPTAMKPTPARLTCSKNGSPRHPPPTRSSAPLGELPPVQLTDLRERELLPSPTFVDRSSG
jgi:hypothetical protein